MTTPAITALGMASALGNSAVAACAAQRAGIVRVAPLPGVTAFDAANEEEMEAEILGAPVLLAAGFVQTGAWIRLGQAALADALRQGNLPPPEDRFWEETALLWVTPELSEERQGWPEDDVPRILKEWCSDLLREVTGLHGIPAPDTFVSSGHAGAAEAVHRAVAMIAARRAKRVLVLCTDSWLDQLSLALLERERRFRTPDRAVGMCPGEAGVCVLLEERGAAASRSAPVQACVASVASRPAPSTASEDDPGAWRVRMAPQLGRALADTILEVLGGGPDSASFDGDVVLDLNGENWRAMVWGYARVHLARRLGGREVIPAVNWGDLGAASGGAGLCVGARALARGYARGDQVLVASVSDGGQPGAVLLTRP